MNDSMITAGGKFVQGHVGGVHVEASQRGVEVTLTAAINPHTTLTRTQARNLARVLTAASE